MSQKQTQKPAPQEQKTEKVQPKDVKNAELEQTTEEVEKKIDEALGTTPEKDIIDEIDEILEPNAQEFVANYIQRGGQ